MRPLSETAPVVIVAVLLAACFAAYYSTRGSNAPIQLKKTANSSQKPVDEPLLETANRVAALAQTADEQDQAPQAVHLADDELDLAFASALRDCGVSSSGHGSLA